MPMITVAIFTIFIMPSKTMEQPDLNINQNVAPYTTIHGAAMDLMDRMNGAIDPGRDESLMVHGFRGGNHGNLNLDDLDHTFANAVEAGPVALYKDPYLEIMRREQGLRPMEKLSAEAMLSFAAAMNVNYVLSGDITRLEDLSSGMNHEYQLKLTLTDVNTGQIIWLGHADVRLSPMVSGTSW